MSQDTQKKITPKQVSLLYGRFREKGIYGHKAMLEWLEFTAEVQVETFEDIPARKFDAILAKLSEEKEQ